MRTVICGISTCFSTLKSTSPGTASSSWRSCAARPRRVSVSSPKTLIAICARTPASRWSSRCEIGCPTATCTGSSAKRSRRSAITASRSRALGASPTSISAACTPSACSSSSARPVRRPTCVTSGTCKIRVSASAPMRFDSSSEVPGCISIPSVSEPSLKAGRKARGKNGTLAAASATATTAAPSSRRVRPKDQCSKRASQRLRRTTSGLSPCVRRFMRGSR